jgi:outer membrane biosynthesis protein TonB
VEGPYREGKPLESLIEPDRRRQRVLILVAVSMVAGAALFQVGRSLFETPADPPHEAPVADDEPPAPTASSTPSVSASEVERVVAMHRASVKHACFDTRSSAALDGNVTTTIVVAANGNVASIETSGNDPLLERCVADQVRAWRFPAHAEQSARINIPFVFVRQ